MDKNKKSNLCGLCTSEKNCNFANCPNDIRSSSDTSKLQAFFYLLLRDQLPGGKIEAMVMDIEKIRDKTLIFSNEYFANYALELTNRLLK